MKLPHLKLGVDLNGNPSVPELDGVPVPGVIAVSWEQVIGGLPTAILTLRPRSVEFEGVTKVTVRQLPPEVPRA